MKLQWALFLSIFCTATSWSAPALLGQPQVREIPVDISLNPKPLTIKVLIEKKTKSFLLEAKGRYRIYNPITNLPISSGILGKRDWLSLEKEGIRWGESFPGMFQLRLVPENRESSLLVNGIQYRGCIEIYSLNGALHLVNEVDIDSYLRSILTSQFPKPFHEEVMQAIAIIARTHAYFVSHRNSHALWHVDSKDVGYVGYGLTLKHLHVDRAVEITNNIILTYQGAPFPSMWTVNSAGRTAPYSIIFRQDLPSTEGVQSTIAQKEREQCRWSFSLSKHQLAESLHTAAIKNIDLFVDSSSEKVYGVRLSHEKDATDFDFIHLQQTLGPQLLKSNDFTLSLHDHTITFTGYGEGHGVGLCLYTADRMAQQGQKAKKILAQFFPETELKKIQFANKKEA